ncbi:hypothetical protein LJB76_01640 [Clostridia bacterium OttesenSCG-928-O13]|nr:hypothetical protein [Clostridia bacterium OttesenSCG-928-O13]
MAVSVDTKIKELQKNEQAADILEKHSPGFKTDKQMKLVGGLTFRALAKFPQANVSDEKLEEIDKELRALG